MGAESARAEEYKVAAHQEKPAEGLAPAVAEALDSSGFSVVDENGEAVMHVWLAKEWPAQADFKPTNDHLYPFSEGQLMGAVQYTGKGADFRDQPLRKGVYTLRYSLQPQDGNHVGTSDTRDFFVLLRARDDENPATIASKEELFPKAAKAAGSAHPAMLALKRVVKKSESPLSIRHDADHELWIVQFSKAPAKSTEPLVLELVVLGHSAE